MNTYSQEAGLTDAELDRLAEFLSKSAGGQLVQFLVVGFRRVAGVEDEFGRGLRIVSRLAREWGASRLAAGKSVWFEQAVPPRRR